MADETEQNLSDLLHEIAKQHQYEDHDLQVKPISSGGANYMSRLFIATITSPGKEDLHLFAKIAIIGAEIRKASPVGRFYATESYFYKDLIKKYEKIQDKYNLKNEDRYHFPKFYGLSEKFLQETVVLENLVHAGYSSYDRFKSVDWKYASKAIEVLAKFHALSFAFEKEYPEEAKKVLNDMHFDLTPTNDDDMRMTYVNNMLKTVFDTVHEKNKERLQKYVEGNMDKLKIYPKPIRRAVLAHADYRPSNLLHKVNDNGDLDIMVVDYQTMQTSSPVTDLLYFIFNGSDEEFRRKHYKELLDHYYIHLCKAMKRLHLNPEDEYSRADFDFDLNEMLPYGLSLAMFTLQIVTVDAANAPVIDKMGSADTFNIKTSDLFAERLNGIVNDYIKWGVL